MPLDEGSRLRTDHEVSIAPGIGVADLGVAALDKQPETLVAARLIGEDEGDDHPFARKGRAVELHLAPRPQGEPRVGVLRTDVDPPLSP